MIIKIDNVEESLLKTAKNHGNSGMVSVPKNWIGRQVQVVLLNDDEADEPIQEFKIEYTGFTQFIKVNWDDGDIMFLHPNTHQWVGHRNQINSDWSFQDDRKNELFNQFIDEIFADEQLLDYIAFLEVDESVITLNGHKVTRIS